MSVASKALVLGGGSGMLGQSLVRVLEEKGWAVTTLSRTDVDYFSLDFPDAMKRRLDELQPDCLFNAVAYTNVEMAESQPKEAAVLNRRLPATLGALVQDRPTRLVHYSTDFVFDGRKKTPYTVDDAPAPLSVYGRTKYEGEQAILNRGLPNACVIRTAWLFGPGKKHFINKILGICREKCEISVVYDQIGSPTYSIDLARYTLELIGLGAGGLFHIVNSGQANWSELAAEAVNCLQMECRILPIATHEFPCKATRPAYSVLDCSSFTRIAGTVPRPWPQALREYLMLEYPDGI